MKEELILFETAKLAKEKGFNESGRLWLFYNSEGQKWNSEHESNEEFCICCTQSLLQKWLRTVGIKVYCVPSILSSKPDNWTWVIDYYIDGIYNGRKQVGSIFDTYEIALEKGLIEALNMIQND